MPGKDQRHAAVASGRARAAAGPHAGKAAMHFRPWSLRSGVGVSAEAL